MNRSQARDLVVEATGRTDKTTLINSALDLAVEEVSSQHLWSDLLTEVQTASVPGVQEVPLATEADRIVVIKNLGESPAVDDLRAIRMMIRTKVWIDTHYPHVEAMNYSRPVLGYILGRILFTVPISDVAYDLRYSYYRLHPPLTLDIDPILIRHAAPAVVAYATFWVFQTIEKHDDAQRWLNSYLILLESAKKVDRSSVVQIEADLRGMPVPRVPADYWLDPFVKEVPQ